MRIGIDIDDTITDSWKYYVPLYADVFDIPSNEIGLLIPYYDAVKHKFTREEFNKRLAPINEEHSLNIPLKRNVKEVIDLLYELGHSVTFITARNYDYINAYKKTKEYLDRNKIKYDKIITHAYHKDDICKEEKLELFIDDSVRNCKAVSETGIEVILFDAPHNRHEQNFKRMNNWEEIYEYIKSR